MWETAKCFSLLEWMKIHIGKESDNDFDMGSLFKIDEDKLQNAFKFDENAMANAMAGSADLSDAFSVDPNTLDLSGMLDLSAINISLPEAPDLSLGNLMWANLLRLC